MKFILSENSVGPLQVGMSRAQVRAAMAVGFEDFKKVPWAKSTTDAFLDAHAHVFYDEEDIVAGIEIFTPSEFKYRGLSLLWVGISDLIERLQVAEIDYEEDELGLVMCDGAVALYVPNKGCGVNLLVKAVHAEL